MPWAAIIPAVASLAGSAIGAISSSSSAAANRDAQAQQAALNYQQQKEFAQHGVRWRVDDAKAAGIHPLYAMGAQTQSFAPSGFSPIDDRSGEILGSGLSQAGQHIGRAIDATRTKPERDEALVRTLALERAGLENDLLRAQILRTQVGPPFPGFNQSSPGGGNSGDVVTNPALGTYEMKPNEITTSNPAHAQFAAGGAAPQVRWGLAANGTLQPFPPQGLIEDQDLTNPVFMRWLWSNEGRRPPESVWRSVFPGAKNIRWSKTGLGWVPYSPSIYRGNDPDAHHYEYVSPYERARRRGIVTVPMPR